MFEVRDGSRTIKFEGRELAESSSWRRGAERWIEFRLYETVSGSFVLSRIGQSLIFHVAACPLVERYNLTEVAPSELVAEALPCRDCKPTYEAPVVFPEKVRYWAQVSDGPEAVIDAVYKEDDNGVRYLTNVAERLLESAAQVNQRLEDAYRVELIP